MAQWNVLEQDIGEYGLVGTDWSASEYAEWAGMEVAEASAIIQSYLSAQRFGKRKQTRFALYRQPGTRGRSTRWLIGTKGSDADKMGRTFSEDVKARIKGALIPDYSKIGAIDPKATKRVDKKVDALLTGFVPLLEAAFEL